MKNYLFILLLSILLLSCNKKEADIRLSTFETPVLTGFEFKDYYGNLIKRVGIPNIKTQITVEHPTSMEANQYAIGLYPNPVKNSFNLYIKNPENKALQVWLVTAYYLYENETNSTNSGAMLPLAEGYPLVSVCLENAGSNENFTFDVTELPEGYYRIYASIGQELLWDNIIISK